MVIQGHGHYVRQVLGLMPGRCVLVRVRRFLCAVCGVTISVLAAWIHPWRWYGAGSIVEALWRWKVLGEAAERIRGRLGGAGEGGCPHAGEVLPRGGQARLLHTITRRKKP